MSKQTSTLGGTAAAEGSLIGEAMSGNAGSTRQNTERETRDPLGATQNVRYITPGTGQIARWDSAAAIEQAYYSNIFVYECVRVTAEAIAALPLRVGTNPEKPSDFNIDHPLAKMLGPAGKPNSEITARTLISHAIASYLVTGKFAWEVDYGASATSRPGQAPVALWPLPANLVKPIQTSGGKRYFSGIEVSTSGASKKIVLSDAESVYGWRPSLDDVREPESVLQAARLNVSVAIMLDQYNTSFLRNNATPSALVVTSSFASVEDRNNFQSQFNSRHQGPVNAGKTAFLEASDGEGGLEGLVDVKQMGLSQKDSQALEQYEKQIQAICVAFGVPLSVLGDASGRTFDNASQEIKNWWHSRLLPLIRDFQDHLNLRLAPLFPGDAQVWFDTSGVAALKPEQNIQPVSITELVQNKIASKEEARIFSGLSGEAPADDEVVVNEMDDLTSRINNAKTLVDAGYDPVSVCDFLNLPALSVAQAPAADAQSTDGPEVPARSDEPGEERTESRDDMQDVLVTNLTTSFARSASYLMGRQAKSVASRLSGKRGSQMVKKDEYTDGAYEPDFWVEEVRQWAEGLYYQVFSTAALIEQRGTKVDADDPLIVSYINERSSAMAKALTQEVDGCLRTAFDEAKARGCSEEEITAALNGVMDSFVESRSQEIAQSEALVSYRSARDIIAGVHTEDVANLATALSAQRIDIETALVRLNQISGASL